MLNWLNENKEWIFSGGGVVFVSWLGALFFNKKKNDSKGQRISSGKNSKNYQSGRDINITERSDINEKK